LLVVKAENHGGLHRALVEGIPADQRQGLFSTLRLS
jgi:hypothetical protein